MQTLDTSKKEGSPVRVSRRITLLLKKVGGILTPLSKKGRGDFIKLIIFFLFAIVLGGLIFYEYQKPAYRGGEGKLEHQEKEIQIIEVEDGKIVRNVKEGYEVKVPRGWYINYFKSTDDFGGELTLSSENVDAPLEMSNTGIFLDIQRFNNKEQLTIKSWVDKNAKLGLEDRIISESIESINNKEILIRKVESSEGDYFTAYLSKNPTEIINIIGVTFSENKLNLTKEKMYEIIQSLNFNL